jgi:hypothetical protein
LQPVTSHASSAMRTFDAKSVGHSAHNHVLRDVAGRRRKAEHVAANPKTLLEATATGAEKGLVGADANLTGEQEVPENHPINQNFGHESDVNIACSDRPINEP